MLGLLGNQLIFPEDQKTYPGKVRFTLVDENEMPVKPGDGQNTTQVDLYMPQGIQIADKMEYENANLGALGAAVADRSIGTGEDGLPSESLMSEDVQKRVIGGIVSKFSEKAGQIAAARNRVSPNPNTRALFKQVTLRNFAFTFKLLPTSEREAETIKEIIKFFRTEMYPEDIKADLTTGTTVSLGYKFPNRFKVEMFYDNQSVGTNIAPAYIDSFMTNYNPTAQTFIRGADGKVHFSEIDINLTLMESKALTRKDILNGGF